MAGKVLAASNGEIGTEASRKLNLHTRHQMYPLYRSLQLLFLFLVIGPCVGISLPHITITNLYVLSMD